MKQPKKLKRNEKILLSRKGIENVNEYSLVKKSADCMTIIHRSTGKISTVMCGKKKS